MSIFLLIIIIYFHKFCIINLRAIYDLGLREASIYKSLGTKTNFALIFVLLYIYVSFCSLNLINIKFALIFRLTNSFLTYSLIFNLVPKYWKYISIQQQMPKPKIIFSYKCEII